MGASAPFLLACRCFGLSLILVAGQSAQAAPAASESEALHAINCLSFGPVPGDVVRVMAMGVDAYVDEQLQPERLAEPEALTRRRAAFELAGASQGELVRRFRNAAGNNMDDKEEAKAERHRPPIERPLSPIASDGSVPIPEQPWSVHCL